MWDINPTFYATRSWNSGREPSSPHWLLLNCTQLITDYTRSTLSSMSTIHHINTSMPELYVCSGVIPCSLSDHDIIYTVFKHPNKSKTQPRVISILDFKIFDIIEYNKDVTCLMDLFKIVYINLHCSLIAWCQRVPSYYMDYPAMLCTSRRCRCDTRCDKAQNITLRSKNRTSKMWYGFFTPISLMKHNETEQEMNLAKSDKFSSHRGRGP